MINSKLYEALVNNYYPTHTSTRINTGGPKGPKNWLSIILLIVLIILACTITYNLYFIS